VDVWLSWCWLRHVQYWEAYLGWLRIESVVLWPDGELDRPIFEMWEIILIHEQANARWVR